VIGLKIAETKNGGAQLSENSFFLIAQKFKAKKGYNAGQPVYTVKLSQMRTSNEQADTVIFQEIKTFILSQKQFDDWLALLIQLTNKKLDG